METLNVPEETEIERKAGAYQGGGTTTVWYRWGYVLAPAGYNWAGNQEAFPTDAQYKGVVEDGAFKALTAVTDITKVQGTWGRKSASALSLGILPVFHS